MEQLVIQTDHLTLYYGKHRGIIDVNLQVEQGEVFGFLGPNGAGKTSTIRIFLDLIRPTSGQAKLFNLDCQTDSVAIRQRLGYVSGELSLPGTMRGQQYLNMVESLRGGKRDKAYQNQLIERLELDPSRRIQEYSRGNKQKLGLVAAFMARPDLLILDEPTSGLDPLMQQTVLELVRETKVAGRTVFFSSHILPEVQAIADRVGIIREGRLVAVERVDKLTAQNFRRLQVHLGELVPAQMLALPGVKVTEQNGTMLSLEVQENMPALLTNLAPYQILDLETIPVTLEEVFLTYYGTNHHNPNGMYNQK